MARTGKLVLPADVMTSVGDAEIPCHRSEPAFVPLEIAMTPPTADNPSGQAQSARAGMGGEISVTIGSDVMIRIPGTADMARAADLIRAVRGVS
jgi:transposase